MAEVELDNELIEQYSHELKHGSKMLDPSFMIYFCIKSVG